MIPAVVRKRNSLVWSRLTLPPPPLPSPLCLYRHPRVAALIFFVENRHYAYTYDEVYSPVSIERIDEADEVKEERWKVISASFSLLSISFTCFLSLLLDCTLVPYLRSATLYTSLSFFGGHT